MFEQSLMELTRTRTNPWSMAASFAMQTSLIGLALLIPIVFTEQIQPAQFFIKLEAPAPPSAPAPPAIPQRMMAAVTRTVHNAITLPSITEPTFVPSTIQLVVDEGIDVAVSAMTAGNIFGSGFGGGNGPGVPGGMPGLPVRPAAVPTIKTLAAPVVPPAALPAPPKVTAPLRTGGDVLQAKLIHMVEPAYPPLARSARISGDVKLDALVGRDGRVHNLRLISGHPLLVGAALEAVRQWVYKPTYLNGEATEVVAVVTVSFHLN